ncbi:MAG: hypothetical protein GX790_06270 [Syntrophomonadaceae bacterium]|nr:hypothetical protein [Syntrophomonadaceae bacterium]
MKVKPKKTYGALWGLLFGIAIFSFCIWGVNFALGDEDKALKIMLEFPIYLFLGLFVLLLIGGFNNYYVIDEKDIKIKWGFSTITIPWENVKGVVNVEGSSNLFSIFGVSWPGFIVGLYSVKGLGTAKMFGTDATKGFLYLKTDKGYYGITPENKELASMIAQKCSLEVETVNMNELSEEVKGKSLMEDNFYRLLYTLNIIFIVGFALYLALFFPGSGAPNFVVLLLVLAIGLFFFNISNAARLFQFSDTGGYVLLLLGIAITGIFWILSFSEITL